MRSMVMPYFEGFGFLNIISKKIAYRSHDYTCLLKYMPKHYNGEIAYPKSEQHELVTSSSSQHIGPNIAGGCTSFNKIEIFPLILTISSSSSLQRSF